MRRCLAAILLLAAIPANAQQLDSQGYRTGLPPVMAPMGDQAPIDDGTVERFRQAYAARKSPRIMAFWNRELDDRVSSAGNVETRMEQRDIGVGVAVPGGIVWGRDRDTDGALACERARDFPAAGFRGTVEMGVRSGVFPGFLRSRGELHRSRHGDPHHRSCLEENSAADQARGEMAGVAGMADLLMEVLATRDPRSPVGTAFKVTVKQISIGPGARQCRDAGASPGANHDPLRRDQTWL